MPRLSAVSLALVLAFASACSDTGAESARRVGDRVVRDVGDTVAVIGGAENDTALFTPTMVTFAGEGMAVWDRDRSQILFYSRDGEPRWRYGSKGSGPGEFASVTDLASDDDGRLWVLDPDNVRISIVGSDGGLIREFPVPDVGFADRLVPIGAGRALLMGMDPMIHTIDDQGNLLSSSPHPYSGYASLHPVSGYNRGLHDVRSDSTVFFFYYGGGFVRTKGNLATAPALDGYVEPMPFPEVTIERSEGSDGSVTTSSSVNAERLAAAGGAANDGVLYVLFQGATEYGHRIIDRYSIGSGEYLDSWLLPDTTRAFAVHDGMLATLVDEPYPALVVRRAPE